jgi:hypothetical protein
MRLVLEWKGLCNMPKVYTRKHHSKISDLYTVLLCCDVEIVITPKRQAELLSWLWRQMKPEHKRFGRGPHAPKLEQSKDDEFRLLNNGSAARELLTEYQLMPGRKEDAKEYLMKKFGFASKDALEKALYRARKKHPDLARKARPTVTDDSDVPF